jgi:hypothetical protein
LTIEPNLKELVNENTDESLSIKNGLNTSKEMSSIDKNNISEFQENEITEQDQNFTKNIVIHPSIEVRNDSEKYICLNIDNEFLVVVEILYENKQTYSLKIV